MRIHRVAAEGFERAADAYERGRPGYPPELMSWMASQLRLGPGVAVLDLAAGTGKLTRELVRTGARVLAVEPVAAMRAQLARRLPQVTVLDGVAEAIPLPDGSVEAVTVAQAFHWFRAGEAFAEIHRVLRPGGRLGVVWNTRDLRQPLQAELDALIRRYRGGAPSHSGRHSLPATPLFAPLDERRVPFTQRLDVEGLVDRVASVSVIAALPEEEQALVLAAVRDVARRQAGPLELRYVTEGTILSRVDRW